MSAPEARYRLQLGPQTYRRVRGGDLPDRLLFWARRQVDLTAPIAVEVDYDGPNDDWWRLIDDGRGLALLEWWSA
jgi:hypothetical protein